jgi:hypothetical protein
MKGIEELYGGYVNYHGTYAPITEVMKVRQEFSDRWANRSYKIRLNSMSVECRPGEYVRIQCDVKGITDWDSTNATKRHTGSAIFTYTFKPNPMRTSDNRPVEMRIFSETGAVIREQVTEK